MAEFRSVTVQRLSFWTVTKLFLLGTCISFAIIFVCMAALAIFGFGPLAHTPYPLSGARAFIFLVLVPLLAPFAAIVSGVGHWALMSIGLWIYSFWRPVTITFSDDKLGAEASALARAYDYSA
jgi:hypothetical protein